MYLLNNQNAIFLLTLPSNFNMNIQSFHISCENHIKSEKKIINNFYYEL